MILVSIIIVNYNTSDLLKACLESIYNKTKDIAFEIIVVDNASVDDSEEMIKKHFEDVIFIQSGDNIGFGKANNLGVKYSTGKFVFFLNSDTLLVNNAIKILSDYLIQNPKVAICGANLYDINSNPAMSFSQTVPGLLSEIDYFFGRIFVKLYYRGNIDFNYTNSPLIINGFISGADMLVRKDVLDQVGLFDPDFFMYFEETELTWRIRKAGYLVVSVPEAKIIHLEGASETIKENSIRRSNKSKYLYYEKINKKNLIKLSHWLFLFLAWSRIVLFYLKNDKAKILYWSNLLSWTSKDYSIYREKKKNKYLQ